MDEISYIEGRKAAWADIYRQAQAHVEEGAAARTRPELALERRETIALLRSLCAEFGDNDWEEDLYLPDIIEKHLGRHLEEA